jgi:hypothetical protein
MYREEMKEHLWNEYPIPKIRWKVSLLELQFHDFPQGYNDGIRGGFII